VLSGTAKGRSINALSKLKIDVFTPMPSANVATVLT
jgi:hypothetical protein